MSNPRRSLSSEQLVRARLFALARLRIRLRANGRFPADELYRRNGRDASRADKTRGALSRVVQFYPRALRSARHQSSGDYAVLARRRDLSITIRGAIDRARSKSQYRAAGGGGPRARQDCSVDVAIYGSTTIYGNYAECESPSSRLNLFAVDSSNSSADKSFTDSITIESRLRGLVAWLFCLLNEKRANGPPSPGRGRRPFLEIIEGVLKMGWLRSATRSNAPYSALLRQFR